MAAYASSGQRLSAFSRSCGVSAITLRSWQRALELPEVGGFEAIERAGVSALGGFRLSVGRATVECGALPPVEWVSELIKSLSA